MTKKTNPANCFREIVEGKEAHAALYKERKNFDMSIVQYLQIGRCLKVLRMESGIRQKDMADRLGLPVATYSNYENGYSTPSMETVQRFCVGIGIAVDDFFKYVVDRASNGKRLLQ